MSRRLPRLFLRKQDVALAAAAPSDEQETIPEVGWMWDMRAGRAAATKSSLKQANIKAKKSLGQNFLTDEGILADIVRAAGVKPGQLVLEVGPGTGNLTRHLAATGAHVLAVEKDDTLIRRLQEEFARAPNVTLVHGDVMRLDVAALLEGMAAQQRGGAPAEPAASPSSSGSSSSSTRASGAGGGGSPRGGSANRRVKVVANLPYNITKEFLKAMLPMGESISELSIMIQEEVARRLVDSRPGDADYRAMSIYTKFFSHPRYRLRIPRQKYFPVPGVDGALVTFTLLQRGERPDVGSERGFLSLVNKAFSERRKMLRNNLQPLFTPQQAEAALVSIGVRPDARAQDLSVQQFVALHAALQAAVTQQLQQAGGNAADGSSSGGSDVSDDDNNQASL